MTSYYRFICNHCGRSSENFEPGWGTVNSPHGAIIVHVCPECLLALFPNLRKGKSE
jgi:hypothetical protein